MKRVRVYGSFENLPAACSAMFSTAEQEDGVFFSKEWFANLDATVLAKTGSLRIYVVEDAASGTPSLALPMHAGKHSGFAKSRTLTAFANYYTCLYGPTQQNPDPADWRLLAEYLAAESPRWSVIDLHPMAADAGAYHALQSALRQAAMIVQPYFCFGNWFLEVGGRDFQQYFASLPARVRNTVKRKTAQIQRTGEVHIRLLTQADEADEAIYAFTSVYAASWKSPEPHQDFMPGLIRLCARKGWLRMAVAYAGERPIAAQFWIVSAGVAAIYKLAYDEAFAKLSIGSILTSRLFEHVIEVDKVREVDYLTGDEPYKKDWTPCRRERWGLVAYNPRTRNGLFLALRALVISTFKRMTKRPEQTGTIESPSSFA